MSKSMFYKNFCLCQSELPLNSLRMFKSTMLLTGYREYLKKAGISRTGISLYWVSRCSVACREVKSYMPMCNPIMGSLIFFSCICIVSNVNILQIALKVFDYPLFRLHLMTYHHHQLIANEATSVKH